MSHFNLLIYQYLAERYVFPKYGIHSGMRKYSLHWNWYYAAFVKSMQTPGRGIHKCLLNIPFQWHSINIGVGLPFPVITPHSTLLF